MANELNPGETRIGWLYDGEGTTPDRAVGLRNTGDAIHLEIPLDRPFGINDPYAYWFQGGMRHADDPDQVKRRYEPPTELMFSDVDGPITLLGCSVASSRLGSEGARGVIRARGAVLGARRLDYDRVHGVRSVIPALGLWTGITSAVQEADFDDQRRFRSLRLELASGEAIPLTRRLNLTLQPSWRTFQGDVHGHLVAVDEIHVETRIRRATNLDEHFSMHRAIRDLLVIAAGVDLGFASVAALRSDDPLQTLGGTNRGEKWAPMVTHIIPAHEPWTREPQFAFYFGDIGTRGVKLWLQLRNRYSRGLRPLLDVLDGRAATLEGRLFSIGVAIEAIGFESKQSGRLSFPRAIDQIVADIGFDPISAVGDWKTEMIAAYTGIKHADRQLPDAQTIHDTTRAATVVLRAWVASQLGATQDRTLGGLRRGGAHDLVPTA